MTTIGVIELSVVKLRERCDPFKGFWLGLDQPLTIEEVDAAIESGNLVPPTNPDDSWAAGAFGARCAVTGLPLPGSFDWSR